MADQSFPEMNVPPGLEKFQKYIKAIIAGVLALLLIFMSVVTINPEEKGVVLQLGKYNRTLDPGLNFVLPFVDKVYKIPVERQLKQEFGYRTTRADVRSTYQGGFDEESLMLSGDLNMAEVEWVVQYRISDPYQYLFRVRNPDKTLRDMSESTMRQVVGNRTVDEVLTVGRVEIETKVVELLQALCYEYENGIRIDQVVLQDVNPPDQVKPSFNAVNEAQQERERLINEAKAEFNKVIPNARGEAKRTIQSAEGYAIARVNEAQGEVAAFNELYSEYVKAPQITKKRIYLETMKNVLPKLGDKIIVDETGQGVLPLLQMKTRNGGTQ
jgi:membrane protease subunit HflK